MTFREALLLKKGDRILIFEWNAESDVKQIRNDTDERTVYVRAGDNNWYGHKKFAKIKRKTKKEKHPVQ